MTLANAVKFLDGISKPNVLSETGKERICPAEANPNSPPLEGCPQGGVVEPENEQQSMFQPRNTKNYMSLPYNPKLKERAKELRQAGNLSEVLLWQQIKNKQLNGLDFDRQKIIGNYIVDFYCSNCNVVVEVDGSSHDNKAEYDKERDEYLSSLGLTIIHVIDADVKQNLTGVMEMLKNHFAVTETTPPCGHPSNGGEFPDCGNSSNGEEFPDCGYPSN